MNKELHQYKEINWCKIVSDDIYRSSSYGVYRKRSKKIIRIVNLFLKSDSVNHRNINIKLNKQKRRYYL